MRRARLSPDRILLSKIVVAQHNVFGAVTVKIIVIHLEWLVFGGLIFIVSPQISQNKIFVTILIGIAGAFLGGFIGSLLGLGDVTGFNLVSVGLATVGALVLLGGYRMFKGGSSE